MSRTRLPIRRVLILADESANWKVAGLRQLDRLVLCLEEFAASEQHPLSVGIFWDPRMRPNERWMPDDAGFVRLQFADGGGELADDRAAFDLVLSTRLFLYRQSVSQLRAILPNDTSAVLDENLSWENQFERFQQKLLPSFRAKRSEVEAATQTRSGEAGTFPSRGGPIGTTTGSLDFARNDRDVGREERPWQYLSSQQEIIACERRFLAQSGKSQDGLVSRYINRPISRALSRWLLRFPLLPTTWSLSIFALPLLACASFLQGTAAGFIVGCAVFQLYSILDGCDGEIARAKFQQSESGRRLDSLCDLLGNLLLALCLGIGLARQAADAGGNGLFYVTEGIVAGLLILLSEGIVFTRRARPETTPAPTKWNSALYQRHHEFFERSGVLFLGEKFAWWVVQLTKRDMAMLGFLALAILGWTAWILHLHVVVSGISSALAANVFLRPAPAGFTEEAG